MRLKTASDQLSATDLSISEIASRVGYSSANSFIRRFKQKTGLTPGEYRKLEEK